MKISLVHPRLGVFQKNYAYRKNRIWQPISVATVAAWLEREGGWEIQYIDAHAMDWDDAETARRVREFAPDVLYFSSERTDGWEVPIPDLAYVDQFFATLFESWNGAGPVRPAHVLIEGPHGSIFPADILRRLPVADAVLRGETEPVSIAALSAIARGEASRGNWGSVKSVSWRAPDGSIVHNPDEPHPTPYSEMPSPAWHLLPMDRYSDWAAPGVPFAMMETSRGCPMPCGYCYKQMFGDTLNKRRPEHVLDEIQHVVERYGVRRIMFQDQIFTLDRKHTAAICEGLIAPRSLEEARVALPDAAQRHEARAPEADARRRLRGDPHRPRDGQRRDPERDQQADARPVPEVPRLRREHRPPDQPEHDPRLPGETEETAMESILFFHRLGIAMVPNVNIPYPKTRYHAEAVERGELRGDGWDEVVMSAGLVGTHLDKATIDRVRAKADRLNRLLRWKKRLYHLVGKNYGRGAAKRLLSMRGDRSPRQGVATS